MENVESKCYPGTFELWEVHHDDDLAVWTKVDTNANFPNPAPEKWAAKVDRHPSYFYLVKVDAEMIPLPVYWEQAVELGYKIAVEGTTITLS